MDLKQKKIANTIGSAIGITLFILALAGVTYAFYRWTSSNINISGESTCFAVDYTKGPNIENESVILFDESTIINNNQITIKNGMALTGLTAGNSTCETPVELTVNLTINSLNNAFITGNSIGAFKYIVANYDPASYQTISTTSLIGETFDIIKSESITSTNKIKLLTDVLTATQKGYLVIFYVDGDLANNDASNSSFSATISAEASQYIKPTLATHITNLYLDNKDTNLVENNGISYRYASIYDKDNDETTSGGLMNDRHGSMDTEEDDGNIRYYGSNPNNYIDIGDVTQIDIKNWVEPLQQFGVPAAMIPTTEEDCNTFMSCSNLVSINFFEDVATCNAQVPMLLEMLGYTKMEDFCGITPAGTPKLYRIIGLFKDVELSSGQKKDLIKIVKDKPIGNYSWDQSPENVNNGYGVNEWSQADLMKLLNPTYENEEVGGSLYWNSASGSCYGYDSSSETYTAIPCDFTNSGLSEEARNKIETVKWNLGGHNNSNVFSNQIYEFERGDNLVEPGVTCSGDWCNDKVERKAIWEGKVALAYPSDYGYAVDFNNCSDYLYNYNNCIGDNWMYSTITSNGAYNSWLITPYSSDPYGAWRVNSDGRVRDNGGDGHVNLDYGVSAVFYLDSALGISTGNGSKATPYVVR